MNGRAAFRATMLKEQKKPKKKTQASPEARHIAPRGGGGDDSWNSRNNIEDNIARAIDHKDELKRYASIFERLDKEKDVMGFLQDLSPAAASELALLALSSELPKVKLEALKDVLDRAGFGKVTKHAVARFDANSSKDEIIATILGSKKDLKKAGIEIIEDDENNEEGS